MEAEPGKKALEALGQSSLLASLISTDVTGSLENAFQHVSCGKGRYVCVSFLVKALLVLGTQISGQWSGHGGLILPRRKVCSYHVLPFLQLPLPPTLSEA